MHQTSDTQAELSRALQEVIGALRKSDKDALWNTDDIANYMRLTKPSVHSHVINKKGFPAPVIIPTGGKRWYAREIKEWVKRCR
jgi:predicted DNA-binding transcriptional regulator AlpA